MVGEQKALDDVSFARFFAFQTECFRLYRREQNEETFFNAKKIYKSTFLTVLFINIFFDLLRQLLFNYLRNEI